jgi:hypothetical protein
MICLSGNYTTLVPCIGIVHLLQILTNLSVLLYALMELMNSHRVYHTTSTTTIYCFSNTVIDSISFQ